MTASLTPDPSPLPPPPVKPERIIDVHTHIFCDRSQVREQAKDRRILLEVADHFGLEAFVVLPLFGGLHPTRGQIEAGNDAAADFAHQDSRVRPFATVYPPHGADALAELRRRLDDGFSGLKIWCSLADEPFMDPLMEAMRAYGKPALIHALHKAGPHPELAGGQYPLESRPVRIAALARRHPGTKIIMAHIGGDFLWSCDEIRDCPNVWTDISGTYCEQGSVEHAVETLGPNRVLFGSDLPGASFINNVAKVMAADLPDDQKDRILYLNARELLG